MSKVVLKLGADVSTDIIYPGRFMATVLPSETPQYAFADLPLNKKLLAGEIPPGSVVVAGKNFGCGSSREQAASCLKGWGLKVIAYDFARIFMQNAINLGLDMLICPTIEADENDEIELTGQQVFNRTKDSYFEILPLPRARQAIIDAGGLIPYTRRLLLEQKTLAQAG
jgi:3-isopropylmalate/(R)-2-methylmalate dehydratase small subunit